MKIPFLKCRRIPGQSVAEYGLALALVLLLSIGALMLLGTNMSNIFSTMLPAHHAAKRPVMIAAIRPAGQANPAQSALQTDTATIRLRNGKAISLDGMPADMAKTIQSLGANGTTALLSEQFVTLAQSLVDEGAITDSQAQTLRDLANQGHTIAEIEKAIEQSALHCGDDADCFFNTPVSVQGHSYDNAFALGDGLGDTKDGPGTHIARMAELLETAKASGVLQDPAVENMVGVLAQNIISLATQVDWQTDPETYTTSTRMRDNLASGRYSQMTNGDSASICHVGNYLDTGKVCQ